MANHIQVEANPKSASHNSDLRKALDHIKTREFLDEALRRFKLSADHEAKMRKDALDDFKFSTGEQWPADIIAQRSNDGRPCLTMDHLQQSLKLITNEQRQQRPGIQIDPVGDGATRKVADILQGIVRHVEVNSDAEIAYDIAFDHMVRGGFGWLRVVTEYIPGMSFDQEIKIEAIRNPFTVYDDPGSSKFDGSDARYRFVIEDVPRDEFKTQYPDATTSSYSDFQSLGDVGSDWATREAIRVAEYYHVVEEKKNIVRLADGRIVEASELTEKDKKNEVARRELISKKVTWTKMTAVEILDERELSTQYIPVVPVYGDDLVIDGKRYLAGMVRNAKDPQRAYNYQISAATEQVALAPRAPYIGAKGQFKSSEAQWKNLNNRNFPYLEYDPVAVGGHPVAAPQRNIAEPPIQATVELIRQANDDIKAATGLYDASLGQHRADESGRAVLARQQQGNTATLNFSDNFARTLRHIGRIIIDLIPAVYDAPRVQRIIKPDASIGHAGIFNSKNQDYSPEEAAKYLASLDGPEIHEMHDVGVGLYDVSISTGPSYQSRRKEAAASIAEFVKAFPQAAAVAGDLLVANYDWPYATEISKRLKKTLPLGMIDADDQSPEAKQQALEQQLQQLTQQHQAATQALQEAQVTIATKQVEAQSKIAIEKLKIEAQITIAEVNTKYQDLADRRKYDADMWNRLHDSAHDAASQAVDQSHERSMQATDQAHAAQLQDSQQVHDVNMQPEDQADGATGESNGGQ